MSDCLYQLVSPDGPPYRLRCAACGHARQGPYADPRLYHRNCERQTVFPGYGPGTELTSLLRSLNIAEHPGCDCKAKAKQMDLWGVYGCREHLETIVGWLRDGAPRWKWTEALAAAARLAMTADFAIDWRDPFRSIVREAIARAHGTVLITGAMGDFLAIDAGLTAEERAEIRTVYHATKSEPAIRELLTVLPGYAVRSHVSIPTRRTVTSASEVHDLPVGCRDLSIGKVFPAYQHRGSAALLDELADVRRFRLPAQYVAIQPSSARNAREQRNFTPPDWASVLAWLDRLGVPGVVLNDRGDRPADRRLVDLVGQTTFPESIEILKGACGFAGAASSLSVLAAKLFPAERLAIKGRNPHLLRHLHVYYAPHTAFPFVGNTLSEIVP